MNFKTFLFFLFLYSLFPYSLAQTPYLTVSKNMTILLELSLSPTPSWILRWNHSVTGVTVSDYYRWDGGEMLLTDSHTPAFDAGLGHIPGRGQQVGDGQHGYFILDIDEPVTGNAYVLRVGSERVDHRIVHAGRTYSISDLAANERVRIEVLSKEVVSQEVVSE